MSARVSGKRGKNTGRRASRERNQPPSVFKKTHYADAQRERFTNLLYQGRNTRFARRGRIQPTRYTNVHQRRTTGWHDEDARQRRCTSHALQWARYTTALQKKNDTKPRYVSETTKTHDEVGTPRDALQGRATTTHYAGRTLRTRYVATLRWPRYSN